MMIRICAAVAFLCTASLATSPGINASDAVGVYGLIEKVVLEPNDQAPERIQVWGAFALANPKSGDLYRSPEKGYLYYSCPAGQSATCANEWADLRSVAGKGIGVAFGSRRDPTGRVRSATEKPAQPDAYPIRMGVARVNGLDRGGIVARLKTVLEAR